MVDRDEDRLAHLPLARQVQALQSIVRSNPVVAGVPDRVPVLNLASWVTALPRALSLITTRPPLG